MDIMKDLKMIFEGTEVKIIVNEKGKPLFELYSTGMELGYIKKKQKKNKKKIEEFSNQLRVTEFGDEVEYEKVSNKEIKRRIVLDYYGEIDQWD